MTTTVPATPALDALLAAAVREALQTGCPDAFTFGRLAASAFESQRKKVGRPRKQKEAQP